MVIATAELSAAQLSPREIRTVSPKENKVFATLVATYANVLSRKLFSSLELLLVDEKDSEISTPFNDNEPTIADLVSFMEALPVDTKTDLIDQKIDVHSIRGEVLLLGVLLIALIVAALFAAGTAGNAPGGGGNNHVAPVNRDERQATPTRSANKNGTKSQADQMTECIARKKAANPNLNNFGARGDCLNEYQ